MTQKLCTLKEARAFHTSSNQSDTQSYFKHLGDMNYQIMIVITHIIKHFW